MINIRKSINNEPSGKSVYIWNVLGSLVNAALSIVVFMIVTRTLNDNEADIFSVAWAISQLMATIGTFQIRTYQATDVVERFKFRQYFWFRIITVAVMMLSSIGYVIAKEYSVYKSMVVLIICMFRAMDSLADVYEGWFQQKERLDLAGKAITFRVILATVSFIIVLFVWKNLLVSSIVLLAAYVIGFCFTDIRYNISVEKLRNRYRGKIGVRWIIELTIEGLPIFVNAFLMMSITNEPKMVLDKAIESGNMFAGGQTIYTILLMPASFLTLAYIVFRPMLTQMAIMWNEKKISYFVKIILKMGGALLAIACLILIGSAILGIPVLSIVYAMDLSAYRNHLLIIILGGCFCTFSYVLDNALIVIRRQYLLVVSYIITWIYVKMVTEKMVGAWGVMGCSVVYATSMVVFFCFTGILFVVCFKIACKRGEKEK